MERANGAMVLAKPYTEVNWTKGIDQKTGKPVDYDPSRDIQIYAGIGSLLGGNNYWPSSYSAKTGLMYIPALSNCSTITIDREKHTKEKGLERRQRHHPGALGKRSESGRPDDRRNQDERASQLPEFQRHARDRRRGRVPRAAGRN